MSEGANKGALKEEAKFLPMPAGQLAVPAEGVSYFPMRHSEWLRLRKQVAACAQRDSHFSDVAWAFVGVTAASFAAYFPWIAVASQLSGTATTRYSYVSPLLAITMIASLVIAIVCFAASRSARRGQAVSIESILGDMDEMYKPHKLPGVTNESKPVIISPKRQVWYKRIRAGYRHFRSLLL
jgi:hypothetical protein